MLWQLLAAFVLVEAAAGAAGPLETLRERDRQIRRMLQEGGQTDARLQAAVNGIFDYETHTRESFGRYWDQMAEPERKEAIRLVSTLLERSSMAKLQQYRSDAIQYVSEQVEGATSPAATVLTRVSRGRETWEIGYRMRASGSQWRIVDVIVEGASTAESNRATFYKEIRASGIAGLIETLRRKVAQP